MRNWKRLLSLLLAFSMVVSYCPAPAQATEEIAEEVIEEVVEEVVEEVPSEAPSETEAAESDEEVLTTEPEETESEEAAEEEDPAQPEEVVEEIVEEASPEETEETLTVIGVVSDSVMGTSVSMSNGVLTIPGSVTSIADYSYGYRDDVTTLILEEGIKTIGFCSFRWCTNISGVLRIPDSVTKLDGWAFTQCHSLSGFELGEGTTVLYDGVFYGCTGLTGSIIFPDRITSIGGWIIGECPNLSGTLMISANATSIGQDAFVKTKFSRMIFRGETAPTLTSNAMNGMTELQTIYVPAQSYDAYVSALSGVAPAAAQIKKAVASGICGERMTWVLDDEGTLVISGTGAMEDYESPSEQPWYAYQDLIQTVVIGDEVTYVGDYACSGCYADKVIFEGNNPPAIGYEAFRYDSNVIFYVPEGMQDVYTESMLGTVPLDVVTIRENIPLVAEGTCGDNLTWTLDENGTLTISGTGSMKAYGEYGTWPWSGKTIKSLIIEEGVTSISPFAFRRFSSITGELVIPNSVTSIGRNAFEYCSGLTSVKLEGPVSLGMYAFNICSNLESLDLGQTTSVGAYAFSLCEKLTGGLVIPESVEQIDVGGFGNCISLTTVEFKSATPPTIVSGAFSCTNLTEVLVPVGSLSAYTTALSGKLPGGSAVIKEPIYYVAEGTCGENLTWTLDEAGTLTISGEGAMADFASASEQPWYDQQSQITQIVISDAVTKIGAYAFAQCSAATTLTIGDGVTSIGQAAFYKCSGLTGTLVLPESLTEIGGSAFSNCGGLTGTLTIPDGVTTIGNSAFYYCTSLSAVIIGEGVTSLGNHAFGYTKSLSNITYNATGIPDLEKNNYIFSCAGSDGDGVSVIVGAKVPRIPAYLFCPSSDSYYFSYTPNVKILRFEEDSICAEIGNYAFCYCNVLASVILPDSVTNIGMYAFYNGNLTELDLGESVTNIGNYAFRSTGIQNLVIPDSVQTIGQYAFADCYSLKSLTIGKGVTSFGTKAFGDCEKLTEINYNAVKAGNLPIRNYLFDSAGSKGNGITVTVGADVQRIPEYLFCPTYADDRYIPHIKQVYFEEDSVCTSIGYRAFSWCLKLQEVELPASLSSIGKEAFSSCKALTSLILPEGLKSIGDSAFSYCTGLSGELVLPESVTSLGSYAFQNCDGLTSLNLGNVTSIYNTGVFKDCDGLETLKLDKLTYIGDSTFSGCDNLETVDLDVVTSINKYAFDNCVALKTLDMGNAVTYIGDYAFRNCTGLTGELTIPEGVTYIGNYAFRGCTGLNGSLVIPEKVATIGEYAFYACSNITEVTFNRTTKPNVGNYAFRNMKNLSAIWVPDGCLEAYISVLSGKIPGKTAVAEVGSTADEFVINAEGTLLRYQGSGGDVVIPDGVTVIGTRAFDNHTGVTSVSFPDGLTEIGAYAFADCTGLAGELNLPDGLVSIKNYAFQYCSGLTGALVIPQTVKDIGHHCFMDCSGFTSLTLPEGITTIQGSTFVGCTGLVGELILPDSLQTIESYAFSGDTGISSITFGENIVRIGQSGYDPFRDCTGVKEIRFKGTVPPSEIYTSFLSGLTTVYVPAAALETYTTALAGRLPAGAVITSDLSFAVGNLTAHQVYSKSAVLTWDVHPVAEGYIVSRDGVELARTGECTYIDRTMETGKSYTYAVSAYSGDSVTPAAELTVTTAAPKVMAISTDSSYHKINDAHNTVRVLVKDSGNLQPLGEDQTVLELFYIRNGEEISAGQGVLKGGIYLVDWDITGLADGEYEMVARLTDVDGVSGELRQNVTIDRSYPAAISGLYANDNVVKIDLSWFIAKEIDTVRYNLYRRSVDEAEFTLLAQVNGRNTLTYTDKDVAENGTYYYYITGVNELGAEGEASAIVGATLAPDITKPVVNSLNPVNGSSLTGNKVTIRVDAEDDVYVTDITLEYSADGNKWTELAVLESGVSSKTIDTTLLPDGTLFFRATARDKAGNTGSMTYQYTVDNTGPDQVTGLIGESTSVTVTLRWNDVQAKDIRYFRVERLEADGSYSLVSSVYDTLGINIYDLTPDTAYTYRVVGYDQRGNRGTESEPITVTTLADTIAPVVTRLRPISNYYSVNIPLQVAVTDDHNVASVTIQTATDLLNWKDVHTETYSGIAKTRNLSYTLDLAAYAEGQLYVRAVAKDSAGNISDSGINAPYVQHVVDKTAPAVPQNVAAEGMGGYVKITWTQGSETDLNTYSVYRAEAADGEYKLLKGSLVTISWNDQTAQQGKTYYYKVCVNDKAGNTSAFSEIVSAEVLADTTKPVINSFYPADGTPVGPGNGNVRISAQDDSGISYVRFEYSADGENYQLLEEMDIDESQSGKAVELPFQNLTHGKEIHIRAWVRDKAGNESAYMKAKFPVDLTAPGGRDGKVAFDKEHNRIRISWIGNGEEDLYRYRIYRTYENKEILIGYCNPEDFQADESGNKVFTFFDESLDTGPVSYVYRVEAVDQCGNTGSIYSKQMDLADRSFPKAVITCENTMHTGVQYKISALDSKDNGKIVSYSWEFDDVYTSDQAEVIHAFAKSGKHSITLEVTDDANLSTKITVEVHVADPAETGTALIQILDESGNKVKGAPVYFDLGSSTQRVATTDSHGQVTFQTTSGKHMVGCVIPNNEYLPVKKEIEVAAGDQSFMAMTLVKQPLVTGAFETNRMTFEEIVAAGIDASRPENQHLMKADVRLAYGTSQVIQTSFIFDMNGIIVDDDIILLPDDGNGRAEPTRVLIPKVLNPGNTEAMTIAFLDMPLEATFLKEFFDVKLHILNNAASDFALVDNVVTLNIPDGLTLVESNESENKRTVTIDSIGGQSTHTVTWILRGDKPGEHHLSADYSGTLSQFNEKINATFQTENPIQVYGLSSMKFVAEISPSINYGAFYFNLSLVNNSDVDVYLPNVDVSGGVIDSYLLRIYEEAEDNTDVLLDPQKPQVRHLNTILENRSGKKQSFGTDTLLTSLAPGEKLTKRFAVYNVVGYNNQLLLREVLEESQAQWGIPFQIVISDMDLYNTDGSADKLAALAGDKQAMYNHILDGSNFFYVKSAVNNSEVALNSITRCEFAEARAEMNLDSADEAEVRAITRKIVAQLMVDEAMEEAIAGGVRDKSQHLVTDMMEDLLKYLDVKKNDQTAKDIHDFLKEYLGNGNGKKTLAEALTRASFDGMLDQLAQELKKAGMTDIHSEELDKYAVSTEFSEAQKLALRKLCQDHIAMLETLDATDSQWHSHADLLQEVLMITTTHEQIQEMLNMLQVQELHPTVVSELEQIKNILTETKNKQNDQFKDRSNNGNKGNGNNGNHGNGNNGNKDKTKENLESVFGSAFEIPENQILIVFGAMADQVAYWDEGDNGELVMKLYNELSMAVTQVLYNRKLDTENEDEASYTLNVLKYLIQLRLLGEQSFAFFGNRIDNSDEQYENWLLRVNETLKTRYDSLDSYADYVLTMLLEFRDSIYVRASETLDVPAAPKVTIDYWNECTEEVFSEEYEYSFDGNTWKTGENDHIHLNPAAVIKHLWIRTKATEEQFAGNITKLLIPARPRIAGDVTVVYDSSRNEYGLVGLTQGVYEYAVTKQQGKETFSKSITIENADAGCRIKGLAQNGTWMALRTEATDSSFCSAIRYVAIRIHVYRWEIEQKHGKNYLKKLDAGTSKQEVELENWNSGYGNACYLPNSNNKSDGYVATGDKVSMNMPDGQMELTIIVTGDVVGNAWVDHDDVDKMIGHVGKYDEDHRLENEYYEAGCVHDGRQEEEDINIYDIYDVMYKVNGNGNKKEAAA